MSYSEQVDEVIAELRAVATEYDCEVGRTGSYDVIVVGGTGETVRPIPEAVFQRARELELEASAVAIDDPTGRPEVGFEFVEPPEAPDA